MTGSIVSRTRMLVLAAVLLGACRKAPSKGAAGGPGGGPFGLPVEVAVLPPGPRSCGQPRAGGTPALPPHPLAAPAPSPPLVDPQRSAVQAPERFAEDIHRGQIVKFHAAALPGRTFAGVVDFVDPVVELPGRTVLVKARVPNESRELRPGMFIEAHLVTAVRPNAVIVPEEAVVPVQGATYVYLVVDAKPARPAVELASPPPGFVPGTPA